MSAEDVLRERGWVKGLDGEWRKPDHADVARTRPQLQKHKDGSKQADLGSRNRKEESSSVSNHRSKETRGYGRDYQGIRYSVESLFYISDNRLRDIDGMHTTIMDCLVKACEQVGFGIMDDNRFIVPKSSQDSDDCEKGQERVVVTLTPIERK